MKAKSSIKQIKPLGIVQKIKSSTQDSLANSLFTNLLDSTLRKKKLFCGFQFFTCLLEKTLSLYI